MRAATNEHSEREAALDSEAHIDRSDGLARLQQWPGRLIVAFWAIHFTIMWLRAQINEVPGERGFLEGTMHRFAFALFGSLLSYGLYCCLRQLPLREFGRQIIAGAGLALVAALVQAGLNTLMFSYDGSNLLPDFIYHTLYWFWFYFSWTAAYLALSYSITMQQQERRATELAVMAQEAQVRALRYQINPHFLFNTLNATAALVRDAPVRAEEMVVQLSEFFRRSLELNPMGDVTLSEEVDLQRLYLDIERTRFPDRLWLDVVLDPGTAEAKVPALLLQPLVENAVKHGVARSEATTCIRIGARLDGPVLEIVVENDAKASGLRARGENVGLHNVRDRLRACFGEEASLATERLCSGGFRNEVRLPLKL
jgi:hypothetical protein